MPTPNVSVIMNCLNGEKYVREALDSVRKQTYKDLEVVFWDNASRDGSAGIAKGYGSMVRYFKSEKTSPLSLARNRAIGEARGRYLAFLDCDDVWLPRKLEKQIPLFARNPRVGLVFSDTIFFEKDGEAGRVYAKYKPPRGAAFRELLANYFLSLETVVVRRDALESLPEWFDQRFEVVEEKDVFLRLAHRYEIDYVDEPLAKWRVHEESWTRTHYELFSVENVLLLEKLRAQFKGLDTEYADEVQAFRRKIAWQAALEEGKVGRTGKCREILRPYVANDRKMASAYLLSYLGAGAFRRVASLYTRYPRSRLA